jgi:AraC-like DNA-binding protein
VHQDTQPTANLVPLADIEDTSALVGRGFALHGAELSRSEAALSGMFRMIRLRSGIVIHTSDTTELHDMTTRVEQQPGLTIHLYLHGAADASLGGKPLDLGRVPGRPVEAVVTGRAEPDLFERRAHQGDRVRKVNVTVSREWLADSAFSSTDEFKMISSFVATHHARCAWIPTTSFLSIAEQMLSPPAVSGVMQNLYLESRALDLLSEAFGVLTHHAEICGLERLKAADRRRLQQIEDFLAEHLHEVTSLDDLARIGGVSASTLRRLFQSAYGTTVFDRLRSLGLERARQALERQGVPVSQAAYLAGYNSAANFATAFKRHFGLTPTDVRRH